MIDTTSTRCNVVGCLVIVALGGIARAEPIRVLILTGQTVHDWKATTPILERMYKSEKAFQLAGVVEDMTKIDAGAFAQCDVIVSNWTCHPQMTGGPWTAEGKRAFSEAIKSGKGMVSIHAASAACNDWEDFQQISGLTWKLETTNHTSYHTFKVVIRDHQHPITQGMPDFWTTDELYQHMVKMTPADYHRLADAWAEAQFNGVSSHEPMLITTELGKGHGVNLLLGHDVRAMQNPAFRTIILRSTEWAATGKVTVGIPTDWPTCAAAAAVVGVNVNDAIQAATGYVAGSPRAPLAIVEQLVMAAVAQTGGSAAQHRAELAVKLAAALAAGKTPEAKSFFCKQLASIGTSDQVAAVAPYLLDEKTSTMARFALERIPGPAAAKALSEALSQTSGTLKIGIVNSLGNKVDLEAKVLLEPLLKDGDIGVAEAAAAALARILACAPAALQWKQNDGSVSLLNRDRTVWQFNYARDRGVPYFNPVNLLDGTELVWLEPPDHPHHHALWFAWKTLNGVNYWERIPEGGVTEVTQSRVDTRADFSARIELALSYHPVQGPAVLAEKRIITVTPPGVDGAYTIDWSSSFTAGAADVELKGGTAGGGYAGFSVRISKDSSEWVLMNSEGRRVDTVPPEGFPPGIHGQRARWTDFSFVSTATGSPAGLAIFDHPANLRYPSQWHDCMFGDAHFGYFSPAPLWSAPFTLPAGKDLVLRYRVVVHPGRPDVTQIEREYKAFAESKPG